MPFDAVFNANEVKPQQGGGAHPVGNKFPFTVTSTLVKPTKEGKGGLFEVEFTSPAGSIKNNYNLWNENETARRIANQELSALCHAVGIFMVDFKNDGAALRGAKGLMDINFQKGQEPSAERPQGGYVELKKVYDLAGNEPGHGPTPQAQPQAQPNAAQQNWGGNTTQQQQPQPTVQQGWTGGAAPQANPAGTAGGWQQGATTEKPPWGG